MIVCQCLIISQVLLVHRLPKSKIEPGNTLRTTRTRSSPDPWEIRLQDSIHIKSQKHFQQLMQVMWGVQLMLTIAGCLPQKCGFIIG